MAVYNCYTDASTIGDYGSEDATSGLAAILVNISGNRLMKSIGQTDDVDDNHLAELSAMRLGLILSESVVNDGDLLRICSDSLSSIERIEDHIWSSDERIEKMKRIIQQQIKTYPCKVEFQWVKAHSNHPINDMADYIAYHHAQG